MDSTKSQQLLFKKKIILAQNSEDKIIYERNLMNIIWNENETGMD